MRIWEGNVLICETEQIRESVCVLVRAISAGFGCGENIMTLCLQISWEISSDGYTVQ